MQASRSYPDVGSSETELRRPTCPIVQVIIGPARHLRGTPSGLSWGSFFQASTQGGPCIVRGISRRSVHSFFLPDLNPFFGIQIGFYGERQGRGFPARLPPLPRAKASPSGGGGSAEGGDERGPTAEVKDRASLRSAHSAPCSCLRQQSISLRWCPLQPRFARQLPLRGSLKSLTKSK